MIYKYDHLFQADTHLSISTCRLPLVDQIGSSEEWHHLISKTEITLLLDLCCYQQ